MDILIGLIIGVIAARADSIWKYFFDKSQVKNEKIISLSKQKPEFKVEIVNKQNFYKRGEFIQFRSKFKGKIKNGYFVNEIGIKDTSINKLGYRFELSTPNVNNDGTAITSFCRETIENPSNYSGNLNGNISTEWKTWEWTILPKTPTGKYIIKMMVLNDGKDEMPLQTIIDEIEIIMPDEPDNPFNRPPRI